MRSTRAAEAVAELGSLGHESLFGIGHGERFLDRRFFTVEIVGHFGLAAGDLHLAVRIDRSEAFSGAGRLFAELV